MDKRWIVIIIILIVGISSLFLIANQSDKIGKAITTIDNVVITLPTDFRVEHAGDGYTTLTNRNTGEKLHIELIKEKNKAQSLMKSKLEELKSDNVDNIENYTQNIANITVYTISYQNLSSDSPVNYTVNYLNKLNKTFIITTSNYDDSTSELSDLTDIVTTLRLDYKMKNK